MAESNHTPTPWELGRKTRKGRVCIDAPSGAWLEFAKVITHIDGSEFMSAQGRANAEFIIRAVNSHDEMLRALCEVAVLGHGKCTIGKPLADMVRNAIKKAEEA